MVDGGAELIWAAEAGHDFVDVAAAGEGRDFEHVGQRELELTVGGVDFKRMPKPLADRIAVNPPFYSQRNFGSSTLDWCNLAAGRLDLYLHGGQKLWDYAAGSLILRETGGQVCTLSNDDYDAEDVWRRSVIAALNPTVFATWRNWVRQNSLPATTQSTANPSPAGRCWRKTASCKGAVATASLFACC